MPPLDLNEIYGRLYNNICADYNACRAPSDYTLRTYHPPLTGP